jgi:hypothetical protein
MSTSTVAKVPLNPAKGNQQGQTTFAAKIDRWQGLGNNLAPQIDQLPQFKEQFAQFQSVLSLVVTLRDRMKIIQGDFTEAITQRDALFAEGDELFTRLSHALKAVHGPLSGRLKDFGLKPRKTGRPKGTKTKQPTPEPAPGPEASAAKAPPSDGAQAAQAAIVPKA